MPRKVCVRHSEAVVHALLICRMILFIIIGNACVIFLRISFFRNQARFLRIWFLRNELLVFANIGPGCAERGGDSKFRQRGFRRRPPEANVRRLEKTGFRCRGRPRNDMKQCTARL